MHPLATAALAKPWARRFPPFIRPGDKLPVSGKKDFAGLSNIPGDHQIPRSNQGDKDSVTIHVAQSISTGDKFFYKDSIFWRCGWHTNLLQGISLYLNKSANSW